MLSGTHKMVEFRRKLLTADPCDTQLEMEKGYYMQYAFKNDSQSEDIGNDLPEHEDHYAKKFRIYLSMLNLNEPTKKSLLEHWDGLDYHSWWLFIMWCPLADFAIILVRYGKEKKYYLKAHATIFFIINLATLFFTFRQILWGSFIVFPYLTLS